MKYLILALLGHALSLRAETIYCSHNELCQMAKTIALENKLSFNTETLVTISGDPHEFEPSTAEIKKLISVPILLSGPTELNPWIKRINFQRSKSETLKTIFLPLDASDFKNYTRATGEELSHFWLYPKVYCSLKSQLENEFQKMGKKLNLKNCDTKSELVLKSALSKIKWPVILTHNALLPLLKTYARSDSVIVAIKGSGHHEEVGPAAIKTMYQALKAPKAIWIKEKSINIPANIINKVRSTDLVIELDTAGTKDGNPNSVVLELAEKLEQLKQ